MSVRINFNICDNSPECSGVSVCPTGAIFWDENMVDALGNKGRLCVDNDKCVSCGLCAGDEGCPIGAISVSNKKNNGGREIKIDEKKVKALFVDRYGAEPIDETLCISDLSVLSNTQDSISIVETYSDSSIQCLLHSIPVSLIVQKVASLTSTSCVRYYKRNIDAENNQEYPILSVFRGNEKIAQINGYFDDSQMSDMFNSLSEQIKVE